ncbi:MAG TPA: tetratricopeptide repeat protein [Promineifilum sp.]|nr:tetratricopeptide repeat protein [Promineifilum sp.]
MPSNEQGSYQQNTLQRVVEALRHRVVGPSAQLVYYGTVLAIIYRIYAGDASSIPLIAASPILARLIEAIGGNLASSVLERVARDKEMGPEEIINQLEYALDNISVEMRDALAQNTEILTLIYRLLVELKAPDRASPDEIAALLDLTQPAANAVPHTPHLLTRIGHEGEMTRLVNLLPGIERTRKGKALFLMGALGSGRSAFAAEIAAAAIDNFHVVAIRFSPTEAETVRQLKDLRRMGRKPGHIEAILTTFPKTTGQAVHRQWTDLMIQLSEAGASGGSSAMIDEIESLGRYVRSAARLGPLVIIIDNIDWAPGYWIDLLPRIAREITLELPVLLLVTMESPLPLTQLHGAMHTEPTRLAQKLVGEGTAASYFLGAASYDDIERRIQPAAGELIARLEYLSSGVPKTVETIWLEWVAQGAVERDGYGRWDVAGVEKQGWVFGDMADHARELLAQALDGGEYESPYTLEETEVILSCAALEGETFTARAVADVLSIDADALMDFLDDFLLPHEESDEPGILEEAGFASVTESRDLCLYRFARPYLYHVWAKYPAAPDRLDEWRRALPLVLEGLYYPYGFRIAGNLARLFAAAGTAEKAQEYRRYGRQEQSVEELRRYIQPLLEGVPASKYEAYRLFDVGFALADRLLVWRSDLWREAYIVARRLSALARCCEDWEYEAEANRLMSWALDRGGAPRRGLFWARRGESLFTRNGVTHILKHGFDESDLKTLDQLMDGERQDQIHLAGFDSSIGHLLSSMGDPAGARPYYERALAIRERVLGPEHPDTAGSLNNLGYLLQAMDDLAGARPYYERALAIRERVLGPEHPDTANSLNNMGYLLQAMGDPAGARPYYERALAISERALGPEHPDTALSLNNMAHLLSSMGDLSGARPYYERALAIRERVLGPEHPDTAGSLNNLGYLLQAMDDLAGARPYYERALAIRERVLGPEHPDTAGSLNNLGMLLQAMGDLTGARPYLERALAIYERVLGPEHPDTASSLNNLGALLSSMGDLAGTRPYYERALAISERVLGPEHPQTAASLNNLGGLLKAMGDLAGARPYLESALAIRERVLGPEHPDTASSLNNLGALLSSMGDLTEARPYFERALAISERVLGPGHPDMASSLNNLGALLSSMGDLAGARSYFERALAILERVLGPEHPDTAQSLNNLGMLLQAMGDLAGARPYLERALAIRERVLGPEHPDTAQSLNNMGYLLQAMGDLAGARPYFEQALAIRERVLGPEHLDTARSLNNMAILCYYEGDLPAAADLMRRALAIREKVLDPNHPDTRGARDNLAVIEEAMRRS